MGNLTTTIYRKDEYVIHSSGAVCKVENICVPKLKGLKLSKLYYVLQPVYNDTSRIYVPVTKHEAIVRRVMNSDEIHDLVSELDNVEPLKLSSSKNSGDDYRKALSTNNPLEWMRVIKTTQININNKMKANKHASHIDATYLKQAENLLYSEIAVSIHADRQEVADHFAAEAKDHNYAYKAKLISQ